MTAAPWAGGPGEESPIDRDVLSGYLRAEAGRYASLLEWLKVQECRVDSLIRLLQSVGTSNGQIAALVPVSVAEAKRKLLGGARASPAWLQGLPSTKGAANASVTPARNVGTQGHLSIEAAAQVLHGAQERIICHAVGETLAASELDVITPASVMSVLSSSGPTTVHPETVRRTMNKLTNMGLLQTVRPGSYKISDRPDTDTAADEVSSRGDGTHGNSARSASS